jgi:hypothetical protein
MVQLNYLAVAVAAIAVFVFSAVYYIALRGEGARLGASWAQRTRPPAWQLPLELGKAVVVALVVAALVALLGITDLVGAVELALARWIGFPVILLIGSVTQENVPPRLAAIYAGDWFVKLIVIAVIVSLWR